MERTKNPDKDRLKKPSFWFCGKAIAGPKELESSDKIVSARSLEVSSILNIKTIICPEKRPDWEKNYG